LSFDPEARIIMLTGVGERSSVTQAIQAGVSGYVIKSGSGEKIVSAIEEALYFKKAKDIKERL
jgi:DNA-binding NarL/FixJ family response regulator